jgi:putative inorganic carbon (HCO3(-)) transporter
MQLTKIILTALIAYFLASVFNFSPIFFIIAFVYSILFFLLAFRTKRLVYFLIIISPLIGIVSGLTSFAFGERYFGINLFGILNISMIIFAVYFIIANRVPITRYGFTFCIVAFLGTLSVSNLYSPMILISLREWVRYAMPALLYFIVLTIFNDHPKLQQLQRCIIISSLLPLTLGVVQIFKKDYFFQTGGFEGFSRIYGSLGHPNDFAMFIVIIFLLAVFYLGTNKSSKRNVIYILFLPLLCVLLFKTYTRIAWISFTLALTILGLLRYRQFYFTVFIFAILLLMIPGIHSQILHRLQPDSSFWERFKLNAFGWSLFQQKPILGYGLGTFSLLSKSGIGLASQRYGVEMGLVPHNDYMRFLVSGGILGFSAFMLLFLNAIRLSFKLINSTYRDYGIFLLSFVVFVLTCATTDQAFEFAGLYFWLFVAMGESYYKLSKLNNN